MVEIRGLCKAYQGQPVLEDVSLSIEKGERVALIGPSGVGKSVLLRCINGLERPERGEVTIGGDNLLAGGAQANRARLRTGMVFQQFQLFSHLTALANIALAPMRVLGRTAEEANEDALALLSTVGLSDKADALPQALSGGQQQRVAIARMLAMSPEVLLFDEPTSALDPCVASGILDLILSVAQDRAKTVLLISHQMAFVRALADRVLYLDERGIYEQGTPQALLSRPERERTKAFLSSMRWM